MPLSLCLAQRRERRDEAQTKVIVVLIASPAVDVLSSCDDGLRDLTLQTHRQATLPVGRQDRLVHRRVVGHDGHYLLEELVGFPVQTASGLDNER